MRWLQFAKTWWGTTILGLLILLVAGLAAELWGLVAVAAVGLVYSLVVVTVKLRRGSRIA
jgi:hypothetical protein